MKRLLICLALVIANMSLLAQESDSLKIPTSKPEFFIAYDFGEAMVNRFQSLSGEVGLSFANKHLIRIVHMNIWLTEAHLKSDFVATVKGDKVKGRMLGMEAFYSIPVIKWRDNNEAIYLSPSLGFYSNEYSHLELNEGFRQTSPTLGLELSYRETHPFGIRGLYYALTLPTRIHFNPHDKTTLGETTILNNRLDGNIWFFVGYQF